MLIIYEDLGFLRIIVRNIDTWFLLMLSYQITSKKSSSEFIVLREVCTIGDFCYHFLEN